MDISFDPDKRAETLESRGLDFVDAEKVFSGKIATKADTRFEYGEDRFITAGYLSGRCVVVGWTPRGGTLRVFSMRFAHADEERRWFG